LLWVYLRFRRKVRFIHYRLLDGTRDFLIPEADQRYKVSWKVPGREHARIAIRNLTIGRNASWYTSGIDVHGNVWVKMGASIGNHGAMSPVGVKDAFFRNDNPYAPVEHREGDYGSHISQYLLRRAQQPPKT